MTTTPNGCQHCGIELRDHMQRWKPGASWHQWTPPTTEQIKARMTGRRAACTTPTTETRTP